MNTFVRDCSDIGLHLLNSLGNSALSISSTAIRIIAEVEVQDQVQRLAMKEAIEERNKDPEYQRIKAEKRFIEHLERTGEYNPEVPIGKLLSEKTIKAQKELLGI